MNPRINLLAHREMRRERRKKDFVGLGVLTVIVTGAVCMLVAFAIDGRIDEQRARNDFIRAENARLDQQIKEIATLRSEIESLRARQAAVESLQTNRAIPVHLMDELVKHTPEGMYLKSMRQDERKVTLIGYAQSNERVSDLLRNLTNRTPWLEHPELIEIKAVQLGGAKSGKGDSGRRLFEFSLNALVRSNATDPGGQSPKVVGAPVAMNSVR